MQPKAAPFAAGDKVPNFALPDLSGTLRVFYNEVKGGPILLLGVSNPDEPAQQAALGRLAAAVSEAETPGLEAFAIASKAPSAKPAFSTFIDQQGTTLSRLLASEPSLLPEAKPSSPTFCSYALDPNQRILAAFRHEAPQQQIERALEVVRAWRDRQMRPQVLAQGAPVLILPNVLEPALCERLIKLWHDGGHREGSVSDGRRNVYAPDTKKNLEHVIEDPELSQQISFTMARRIGPELSKVFNFGVAFRFEVHIVLSYQDHRQDFFGIHRDNHRPDSPRMFAASTNLNDDFEGGTLHFPEYGPHGYRPPAGGSAVFSCNLLHEARPVTRGQRFAMTSFFCLADKPLESYPAERRRQMQV